MNLPLQQRNQSVPAMPFSLNPAISSNGLEAVMKGLGLNLPHDYKEFLLSSNGGEGLIGENYIVFWRAEDLEPLNAGYEVANFAPGFLLFGSDGGGEAYAFDTRKSPWEVVQIPFIGMDDPIARGSSFTEFCASLRA